MTIRVYRAIAASASAAAFSALTSFDDGAYGQSNHQKYDKADDDIADMRCDPF